MTKFMQRRRKLVVASFAMLIVILMALFVSAWMYLQADLALRREIAARAETQLVSDFFTEDLLASVYPEKAKGPEVTVHYILDNAVKNLRQKLQDAPVSEAKVRSAIGSAYRKLGDYNAAEEHLKLAFKIYGAHLGREHPITLHSMLDLGSLYVEYGRFLESEPLLLEAIEMQTRVLGGHHADTLESMAMLGWQYTLAHTKPEADRLIDAVLHHGMRVLGEEHAIVLRAMSYRAYRLLYDRKYEEAEDLARKGLGISERLLGSEHERSIFFRNLITDVYQQTSRCELGTAWGSETLDMCERTLGDEHPQSLVAMRLLGDIYRFQGFPDQALPLLRKSTESCIRVLGEQHTFTLLAIFGLSEAYREMGQYEKCDDLICMGLRITDQLPASNKKQRNPNMWFRFLHPRDIRIRELRSLARTRFDAKDYEAALSAVAQQEKFLNVRSEKLEPQDLKLRVMSLSQLGDIRRAQQALRQLRIIYDEKEYSCRLDDLCQAERSCVERGDETYAIWELVAQGKWDEASNQFHTLSESQDLDTIRSKETFESLAKVLTRGHGTLARAASGQAEFGEAIHHYNEAIRIDPSNEVLLNELAVLLATCPFEKFRDGSRAVSLAQQLCEISNWDHAACLDTLACAYAETGDFTAASRYAKEAISKIGSGEQSLLNHVRKRLQLFQSEKSCRSCEPELVAWWPFELSDTGTVLDASGNAHDGRLQGDARITVDPDRGNVLSLSGDGYVDLDDDQVLDIGGATTVSLWILVEVVTQYHSTIIDIPIDGAGCPSVHLRHPGIIYTHYAGLTPEGGWPAVSTRDTYDVDMEWQYTAGVYDGIRRPMHVVADSSWHHIVSVYDGAKISLYLDGELFGSILATGSMSPGNSPICIGANSSTNNRFTGRLDDVRIYNYALTASQIKALWAEEKN